MSSDPTVVMPSDPDVAAPSGSAPREMPVLCGKLESQNSKDKPTVYIPCVTEYKVGSDSSLCHVRIRDCPSLSGLHCKFTAQLVTMPSGLKLFVVFLQNFSENGTFINGEQVANGEPGSRLFDGAIVTFGGTGPGFLSCIFHLFRPNTIHSLFKVVDSLGSGATGQVYRAISRKTSSQFAIKVVKNQYVFGRLMNDGRKEYELLKRIHHNNVVDLRALFSDADAAYVIMDLAICDLELLVRSQELAESTAQIIARQTCEGLLHVHNLGIMHRDVKPANLLIFSKEPILVKLADFGLAREIKGDTAMQTVCGTPLFAAPEVALCGYSSSEHYSEKADAFSLGVTLFYMLAVKYPWDSRDLVVDGIGVGYDARTITWYDEFSDHARDIISKLLVRSPKDRLSIAEAITHNWLSRAYTPTPVVGLGDQHGVVYRNPLGLAASIMVQGQPIPVVKDTRPLGPY